MIRIVRPEGFPGVELQQGCGVTGDVPRHWHEEYELYAVTGGYGKLHHGGTTYANPAGTLNLVEPGEVHSNQTPDGHSCDFLKLDFDPALLVTASAEVTPRHAPLAFSTPSVAHPDTFRRFVRLYRTLALPASPLACESALLDFLVTLLRRHMRTRATLPAIGSETKAVRLVREYLAAHYASKVDLAQIAVVADLSPFHLTRVFTRHTGMPPHAFLTQIRIARAKALLRTRVPVARVAAETGFADQSHLTRVFKQVVRVGPGAYRN
jgi:AraC-like DNA-binding protein